MAQHEAREYGHTILRLIESFAAGPCIPSMVGIGENLDHLKLRVAMIGRFARRPLHWALLAGMAALCLGIVTLTDARVPRAGQGDGAHVDALEKNPGAFPINYQPYLTVASYYTQRGIHLDRVPGLVDKALQRAETSTESNPYAAQTVERDRWRGWSVLVEACIGLKQLDKAHATLAQMSAFLARTGGPGGTSSRNTQYQFLQGRLAEAENRKAEAVSLYQSVLRDRAGQGGSISATSGAQLPDPLIGQTEALWKELRRPETAWQSFLAELQNIRSQQIKQRMPAWKSVQIPLPEFRLVDAQGKTWQLSDLKGKTSFIQVWAVWSSKHNDNLKPVQGLYDRLKDRRDVLFLTLNADEYTPQIEPFLKEKGYTFPVIPAYRYVESISRFTGSGQSWILDRTGTIRMQLTGYIAGADAVNEALAQIDRLAQGK